MKENYWSDWWCFYSNKIDSSAKSYDLYPSELPFHATNTPRTPGFNSRVIIGLSFGLSCLVFIVIIFLIVKKLKKRDN